MSETRGEVALATEEELRSEALAGPWREFAFAEKALARGWLRLWIAEADGPPAAAWYGWRIGRRYCYALAGLAREFEKLALGTVLLAKPHHPARLLADSGVRLARAAEGMPPGVRKPISSALRLAGRA